MLRRISGVVYSKEYFLKASVLFLSEKYSRKLRKVKDEKNMLLKNVETT